MASFDVERGFISKLLQTKDLTTVKDKRITVQYFSGDAKNAFQYIYDQVMATGEVPSVRAFKRKFPRYDLETIEDDNGVEVVGNEENLTFWCNELRTKKTHNTLVEAFNEAGGLLEGLKTSEALAEIKKTLTVIESELVETEDQDITKDVDQRIERYKLRKENKGMIGIPSGIRHLDYLTKGNVKDTLTTIIANTGVGKTWLEILIGSFCMLNNFRVLQFVTEMSTDIMRDRYEAVLFSMCYKGMNYAQFKSGTLPSNVEKQYYQFLTEDLPNMEPLIVATATGVLGVSAAIETYKPDIVLIDSAYLMEDDQGAKDDWLRVAHITRDLKKLAKRLHIPIIINTQADKNTSRKTGPELGSIMYTQAIGQDSDTVIALYRDEVMFNDNEMGVRVLKQREGSLGKFVMNWNFDCMDFSEIYLEESGPQNEDGGEEGAPDDDSASKNTLNIYAEGSVE